MLIKGTAGIKVGKIIIERDIREIEVVKEIRSGEIEK